ncbi:MAG: aminopeptidase P N-terminal domain-containing protein [Akkermansia sp.]
MYTQRYKAIPASFYQAKRDELAAKLAANSLLIIHSNDIAPTNADGAYAFQQNTNFFYLTGIDQEESVLLMRVGENGEREDCLLLRETNDKIAVWEGARLTQAEGMQLSGISDVRWTNEYKALLDEWVPQSRKLYFEVDQHLRRFTEVQTRNERMAAELKEQYPALEADSIYELISEMRLVKSEEEIEQLREACRITGEGYLDTIKRVKAGMGEWEIEASLGYEYIRRGSRKHSFLPIVASGANACVLHYISNHGVCKDGDMVLFDTGAEYGNYCGDMSRVIPVNGSFTPRQREIYDAVAAVHLKAMEFMKVGVMKADYEKQVQQFMGEQLVKVGLLTQEELDADLMSIRKYFMHGTSHPLGLDVHDVGPSNPAFAVGQVWTIEPGIYVKEEGIGYRLETDVVIREDGVEDLLAFVPLHADDVEAAMR